MVKIKKKSFFFSNDPPLQIWTLKLCLNNISKSITARCFKLCQLIEDDISIDRVGTSIVQPVNSSGKYRKIPAWQILQKSLKWQRLAFMNNSKLKTCEIKNLQIYFAKNDTGQ